MLVNFYATFRLIAGLRSIEVELGTGATVRHLVEAVLIKIPALKPHWQNERGEMYAHVHGFVNGQEISTLPQGWDTMLNPTDVLDFIPPVAGGSRQADRGSTTEV